jgi:hypothetical protein
MSDDKKIIKLSDHDDRSSTWSIPDMLDYAKKVVEEEPEFKKAIVILLDDKGRHYTRDIAAGFCKTSEVIALLDIEKARQRRVVDPC